MTPERQALTTALELVELLKTENARIAKENAVLRNQSARLMKQIGFMELTMFPQLKRFWADRQRFQDRHDFRHIVAHSLSDLKDLG